MNRSLQRFKNLASASTLLAFLWMADPVNVTAQCVCNHTLSPPASPTTSLVVNGLTLGVLPGQTICLNAGFYRQIRFQNFSGTPQAPITIINCGGLVTIGDSTNYGAGYGVDITGSKYLRFTGTGDSAHKYGIKIGRSGNSGLTIGGQSTDTEIDHLEIGSTGFAGILAKTDFGGNPPASAPEMNNVNIHDTYIHDTWGEGMYIGETKTPGQNFRHLRVWNNIITRTGWDLIQIANSVEDVKVHNNVFYHGGTRNVLFQNKGLQIADNSVGEFYNNFIINSPSNAMIVMGSGNINIYNNYFSDINDAGFFIDNRTVTIPGAPINIHHNYMMDVAPASQFFLIFNELNPINITHNTLEGDNVLFAVDSTMTGENVTATDNTVAPIARVQFMDIANDDFRLVAGSPYEGIGLDENAGSTNHAPLISLIPDQVLEYDLTQEVNVSATDADGDGIILEAFNVPSFVSFVDKGNGIGTFSLAPEVQDLGIHYKVRVRATDSQGAMNTQYFKITVADRYAFIATASKSDQGTLPKNTLDGNMGTKWSVYGVGQWIAYDLREEKLVDTVKIAFHEGTTRRYFFDIEVSDDNLTWRKVLSDTSSGTTTAFEVFTFAEERARHLRIKGKGNAANTYNSYFEVDIVCVTAPQTHLFSADADAYLKWNELQNTTVLKASRLKYISFIRFNTDTLDVDKAPAISASLKLMAVSAGSGTLKVYEGDDTPWDEQYLSWFHRPWKVRRLDALTQDFVAGQEYELDVLPAMHKSGARTFILEYEWSIEGIAFSSREGTFAPQLVVQTLRGAPVLGVAPQLTAVGSLENTVTVAEDIRVYPNPLQEKLTIEMQDAEQTGPVSIELYDHLGTPVYRKDWLINGSNHSITIDLGGLSLKPGFYVFKLRTADNRVTTQKLYKK
jgi:hypothetical protein